MLRVRPFGKKMVKLRWRKTLKKLLSCQPKVGTSCSKLELWREIQNVMGQIIGKEQLSQLTDNIPGLTTYHCAIVGLDTAGKTTVLYRLKFDQYVNAAPTIGFNCEKVGYVFLRLLKII